LVVDCLHFIVSLTSPLISLLCKLSNIIFFESGGAFGSNLRPHAIQNTNILASTGILSYTYPITSLDNKLKQNPHLSSMDADPTTLCSSNIKKPKPSLISFGGCYSA